MSWKNSVAACRSISRYPISSMMRSRGIVKTFSLSSKRPSFSGLKAIEHGYRVLFIHDGRGDADDADWVFR